MLPKQIYGLQAKLFLYIAATAAVAVPMLVLAIASIALNPPRVRVAIGVLVFLAFTLIADLKPMPMHESGKSDVSVANVFTVTAAVLLGWQYAVPIAALSIAITMFHERVLISRVTFNVATYSIAACVAAIPVIAFGSAEHVGAAHLTGYMIGAALLNMVANGCSCRGRSRSPKAPRTTRLCLQPCGATAACSG